MSAARSTEPTTRTSHHRRRSPPGLPPDRKHAPAADGALSHSRRRSLRERVAAKRALRNEARRGHVVERSTEVRPGAARSQHDLHPVIRPRQFAATSSPEPSGNARSGGTSDGQRRPAPWQPPDDSTAAPKRRIRAMPDPLKAQGDEGSGMPLKSHDPPVALGSRGLSPAGSGVLPAGAAHRRQKGISRGEDAQERSEAQMASNASLSPGDRGSAHRRVGPYRAMLLGISLALCSASRHHR